uniref:Uncharacterized protein n=1 Tax=Glossina pallidipes TaxID=7398 RepID=A0A1A9Z7H4_GLOPL
MRLEREEVVVVVAEGDNRVAVKSAVAPLVAKTLMAVLAEAVVALLFVESLTVFPISVCTVFSCVDDESVVVSISALVLPKGDNNNNNNLEGKVAVRKLSQQTAFYKRLSKGVKFVDVKTKQAPVYCGGGGGGGGGCLLIIIVWFQISLKTKQNKKIHSMQRNTTVLTENLNIFLASKPKQQSAYQSLYMLEVKS